MWSQINQILKSRILKTPDLTERIVAGSDIRLKSHLPLQRKHQSKGAFYFLVELSSHSIDKDSQIWIMLVDGAPNLNGRSVGVVLAGPYTTGWAISILNSKLAIIKCYII